MFKNRIIAVTGIVACLWVEPVVSRAFTQTEVFGDAKWIGVADSDVPFYAYDMPVFTLQYNVNTGNTGSATLKYGANDPRLLDKNYNIYNIAAMRDSSYVAVTVGADARLSVVRRGYCPGDIAGVPVASFNIPDFIPGKDNRVEIRTNLGNTDFIVNGVKVGSIGLNPVGNGGDYLAFPVLADIGVDVIGDGASISDITAGNLREPGNTVVRLDGRFTGSGMMKLPVRSMPELSTAFETAPGKRVAHATLTATARGIYDIEINGRRVTDNYFNPGSTQYNKTHLYQTYDVTPMLRPGANSVTVSLGEGWWSGGATFVGESWNFFGDRQSFISTLKLTYDDGSEATVVTDPATWSCSVDGPRVTGSFFQGEIYDASRTDRQWKPAVEIPLEGHVATSVGEWDDISFRPSGELCVMAGDTLAARSLTEPRPGVYIYDFGQNFAGVPLIDFSSLAPGKEVTIRSAEVLYPDMPQYSANRGMIMTENLRAAMCRDIYKAGRGGGGGFSPRFTLHGFRYVELTGLDKPLPVEAVKAIPLSSIKEFKAHYECSDSLVNRLWENIKWSTSSNFLSIPTDCPQRNERLGWMGDISVFSSSAVKLADVSALLARYIATIRDCQLENGHFPNVAPTDFGFGEFLWGSAGIVVPWQHYQQYGDTTVLRDHFGAMRRYIGYVMNNSIDPATGVIVQNRAWSDLGDWLSPEYDRNDKSLLWECYLIYDLGIMEKVADVLGDDAAVKQYRDLRRAREEFFRNTYIDPSTGMTVHSSFDPGKEGQPVDTQVSYALPLAMGIVDDPRVVERFVDTVTREAVADDGTVCPPYSLMTGFIGTAWISKALSGIDRHDLAYRLLTSTSYPSWLYPVTQGATTVWERLNSYTDTQGFGRNNSMNSFNHYSFGAVADWMLTHSLGIRYTAASTEVEIRPEIDTTGHLTYAKGYLDTAKGRIESSWRREGDVVRYDVVIPEGLSARFIPVDGDGKQRTLGAGHHEFVMTF